jgi:DNA ligase D-like protein (predicted 3'-phosphoesterase)
MQLLGNRDEISKLPKLDLHSKVLTARPHRRGLHGSGRSGEPICRALLGARSSSWIAADRVWIEEPMGLSACSSGT